MLIARRNGVITTPVYSRRKSRVGIDVVAVVEVEARSVELEQTVEDLFIVRVLELS